jgi:group I intron endonuclease
VGRRSYNGDVNNDKYMGSGNIIKAMIAKHGVENFSKTILETCETKQEAWKLEEKYIIEYKAQGKAEFNISLKSTGGVIWEEGHHPQQGRHLTENHKEKISSKVAGELNPMYGIKGEDNPSHGLKRSEEEKSLLREKNLGENNPMYGKSAYPQVLHVETGIVYNRAQDAQEATGIYYGSILKVCQKKPGYGSIHGNHFEFVGEVDETKQIKQRSAESRQKTSDAQKGEKNPMFGKTKNPPIRCIETGEVFTLAKQAGEHFGIKWQGIYANCKGYKKSTHGKHFEFITR